MEGTAKVPTLAFHHIVNNPTGRANFNYSIINELTQSLSMMFSLEVLRTCPLQHKSLLSALGGVDPYDSRLITFDLDQGEP